MAGKGSTFTKRQKERSRQEKQREKAQRRLQRKDEKQVGGAETDLDSTLTPLSGAESDPFARNDVPADLLFQTEHEE
jgi:hypothetical protein